MRELILARILAILKTIPDMRTTVRNPSPKDSEQESRMPILALFDGDEEVDEEKTYGPGSRPGVTPLVVNMYPQVVIFLQANPDAAGTALNTVRAQVVQAIRSDSTLAGLTKDAVIKYSGAQTDLALGRTMTAVMVLSFTIPYIEMGE